MNCRLGNNMVSRLYFLVLIIVMWLYMLTDILHVTTYIYMKQLYFLTSKQSDPINFVRPNIIC